MKRPLHLLPVALLVCGILLSVAPATAAAAGHQTAPGPSQVDAPARTPDDDALPPAPRFVSAQRSPLSEAADGPQLAPHPACPGLRIAAAPSAILEEVVDAARAERSAPAIFLLVCSFLS